MEDPLKTIITLLDGNIAVKDNDDEAVTVEAFAGWPKQDTTYPCVSVIPVTRTQRPADKGSFNIQASGVYQADIWVPEESNIYYPEKMLNDIEQEIDRLLWISFFGAGDVENLYPMLWRHVGVDPDKRLIRASCEINFDYWQARPTS